MFGKISSPSILGSFDGHFKLPEKFDHIDCFHRQDIPVFTKLNGFFSLSEKLRLCFLLLEELFERSIVFTSFDQFHLVYFSFLKKTGNYCLVLSSLLFETGIGCTNKRVFVNEKSLEYKQHSWGGIAVFGSLQPPFYLEERTDLMDLGSNTLATKERDRLWKV